MKSMNNYKLDTNSGGRTLIQSQIHNEIENKLTTKCLRAPDTNHVQSSRNLIHNRTYIYFKNISTFNSRNSVTNKQLIYPTFVTKNTK